MPDPRPSVNAKLRDAKRAQVQSATRRQIMLCGGTEKKSCHGKVPCIVLSLWVYFDLQLPNFLTFKTDSDTSLQYFFSGAGLQKLLLNLSSF
ncbi:hypothetical protein NDU88_000744 [Pleurodeles waltl]|uniref:Uncharacterized protein n=1 Tax=Pleurodeles waltl TaxID=8319 RepID=A0AAV7L9A9_PLEWA|nr:hypothetical protein NDU88_000744 [Pleurodeles waltl]